MCEGFFSKCINSILVFRFFFEFLVVVRVVIMWVWEVFGFNNGLVGMKIGSMLIVMVCRIFNMSIVFSMNGSIFSVKCMSNGIIMIYINGNGIIGFSSLFRVFLCSVSGGVGFVGLFNNFKIDFVVVGVNVVMSCCV